MVEIAIFWFQIHITNGLNFMHRKWYTGNQYMDKSAENRMRSNLELLPVINVKSRPLYISAQKISTLFWCTEWVWNWQIIRRFASIHGRACFNRWKEHPYIELQYTPKSTQKYRHGMCFRASSVFVLSILFWFPQRTHYFWRVFRILFMEHKQDYSVTSVKDVKVCF